MTNSRVHVSGALLLAVAIAACSDGTDDGTGGTGGSTTEGTGGLGSGGLGSGGLGGPSGGTAGGTGGASGSSGVSGGAGTGDSPTGGTGGEVPTGNPLDQQVRDLSEACAYSSVLLEIEANGDAATEGSIHSYIKKTTYDSSTGTKFIIDTVDGDHLELTWQPPAPRPGIVDFSGLLQYSAQAGAMRSLCVQGRVLDAHYYPVENYYPFIATNVFEATAEGVCTTTPVTAKVSGCFSENYNLR